MQSPCLSFETVLATHCAPVFFGKKPAALFPQRCLPDHCPWQQLRCRGFQMLRLYRRRQSPLVFVYHPRLLQQHLDQQLTRQSLTRMGYPTHRGWQAQLAHLCRRFQESEDFPHEVGFFLGYPPGDVLGFMEGAMDHQLCGPWKVYGDVDRAATRFNEYACCRRLLLEHLRQGGSILRGTLPTLDRRDSFAAAAREHPLYWQGSSLAGRPPQSQGRPARGAGGMAVRPGTAATWGGM